MTVDEDGDASARRARDSVFLHAMVIATNGEGSALFRVRNISSGGLMAEGPLAFVAGDELDVDLRNIGLVHGRVAWASSGRFGMMFDRAIDPKLARKPVGNAAAPVPPTPHRPIVSLYSR